MRRHLFALVLTVFALTAVAANAAAPKRTVPSRTEIMQMQTQAPTGRIVIKFTDESQLLVTESGLAGRNAAVLSRMDALLHDKALGNALERRFEASPAEIDAQRLAGEARTGAPLPNLNRYGHIDLGKTASRTELMRVLEEILTDPAVEVAFLEPKAVPAALGFDAFTGRYERTDPPAMPGDITIDPSKTPDYSNQQYYLGAPPYGVNALAVDGQPGARGANMQLVDIEGAWVWDHEDLPAPFYTRGVPSPDQDWRDHGTAVLGEIRGTDNGIGVRGITPDAAVGGAAAIHLSVSSSITYASINVNEGDVVMLELHAPGPNANGDGQFGYVCMEYWQDNFDAILVATSNGRIVCEPAGNGYQNLDDGVYGNLFNRNFRDSGAIMCGAANSTGHPYDYSNYGSRLDLNGWGGLVVTCAYGDLQGGLETEWYTGYFSGTSSATPIVAGAVLAFQGMIKAAAGEVLDPFLLRDIMTVSGTAQQFGNQVGPRPDIVAAFDQYGLSLGEIEGTVTEVGTGTPLENVLVTLLESGDTTLTGPDGVFHFDTFVGPFNLEFNSFHHEIVTVPVLVEYGLPSDGSTTLTRLPHIRIVGRVTDLTGAPLSDVSCSVVATPPATTLSDVDGKYTLDDIPIGVDFGLLFDGKAGYGADYVEVTAAQTSPGIWPVHAQLTPATHLFQWWPEGFVIGDEWNWGTPTLGSEGPVGGISNDKCLGIGMDGTGFPADGTFYMDSPGANYAGNDQVYLSFHYYCDLEDGVDGVKLQFLAPGEDPIELVPLNGYTHDQISALDGPGWSGSSGGWRGTVFDLSEYTENYLTYQLVLMSDSDVNDGYFLFDEVTYSTGYSASDVPEGQQLPAVTKPVVAARPNPFNPQTTIRWAIAEPGQLAVQVYDPRGRLVRTLVDGYSEATGGTAVWDGRDNRGRGLSSGTYLVRVSDGQGRATTTAVSLIK